MIASYLFGVCSGGIIMVAIIAISDAIEAYQYKKAVKESDRRKRNGRKEKEH